MTPTSCTDVALVAIDLMERIVTARAVRATVA
jgi:hypothetical protein